MFCPKCGTTLPDGSQFCPACGAQLGAQAPQQAAPQQAPAAAGAKVSFNLPKIITIFFALMCFIFGFLPLIHVSFGGYGSSGELFSSGSAFSFNALVGIALIIMIIQIIVFIVYLISQFVDLNKYLNLPINLSEKMPIIYFATYGAALLFTFIGALVGPGSGISGSPAVCWYFAVVFCACGLLFVFKPNILDNVIKKPQ